MAPCLISVPRLTRCPCVCGRTGKILEENYAKKDPACEARVKALYKELELERIYREFETETHKRFQARVKAEHGVLPEQVFTDFAAKVCGRAQAPRRCACVLTIPPGGPHPHRDPSHPTDFLQRQVKRAPTLLYRRHT